MVQQQTTTKKVKNPKHKLIGNQQSERTQPIRKGKKNNNNTTIVRRNGGEGRRAYRYNFLLFPLIIFFI